MLAHEKKIVMKGGILGFEEIEEFLLFASEYEPFYWLQSSPDKSVSFLVVDPFLFFSDYEIDVDDSALEKIGITDANDVLVLSIITAPGNGNPITANLQGPLIINKQNNFCMQLVLTDDRWQTKHPLLVKEVQGSAKC